jgi:hypothetical protein
MLLFVWLFVAADAHLLVWTSPQQLFSVACQHTPSMALPGLVEHSQHIDWRYCHVTTSSVHAACVLWLLQAQSNMPLHLIDLYNFKPPADLIVNREESQAIRINAAKTSLVRICGCGIACIRRSAQLPASTAACQPTMPERWPCLAPECWTA